MCIKLEPLSSTQVTRSCQGQRARPGAHSRRRPLPVALELRRSKLLRASSSASVKGRRSGQLRVPPGPRRRLTRARPPSQASGSQFKVGSQSLPKPQGPVSASDRRGRGVRAARLPTVTVRGQHLSRPKLRLRVRLGESNGNLRLGAGKQGTNRTGGLRGRL